MKKLSMIPAVLLIATILISCSKDPGVVETGLLPMQSMPLQSQSQQVKIISQWFNPVFEIVSERNAVYLKAHQVSCTPLTYDRSAHAELGFVKLNYQGTSVTRRMPVLLAGSHNVANELYEIGFGIGNTGCDVTIRNADRNSPPVITANPFPDVQIRYIVIPKALIESSGIDWDNYAAVAQALNI